MSANRPPPISTTTKTEAEEYKSLLTHKRPSWSYYLTAILFSLAVFYFFSARLVEIIDSSFIAPFNFAVLVIGYLSLGSLFITPPKTLALTARRFGLIIILLIYLKSEMDSKLHQNIPAHDLTDHIAIVTGGNSGIGFSTVKHLVGFNATVIMACRSMDKCEEAVKQVQVAYPHRADHIIPYTLDLSDLESIAQFTEKFKTNYQRLDILVNNAGLICPSGRRTKQGFEELLGSMHIGHYALTKWLLDLMSKPITGNDNTLNAARIVNVASEAFTMGKFHPSIFIESGEGDFYGEVTDNCPKLYGFWPCCPLNACPYTNGYARAKLANILHMQELQRRYDEFLYDYRQSHSSNTNDLKEDEEVPFRRIVTSSLHPGSVSSNIASLLKYSFLFLRDIDEAAWVVIDAIFNNEMIPASFLDTMKGKHDFISYRKYGLEKHLSNHPRLKQEVRLFHDDHDQHSLIHRNFSIHTYAWENTVFIQPMIPELAGKSNREIVHLLKVRLWDVTESIVSTWEKNRHAQGAEKTPLLGQAIKETKFSLGGDSALVAASVGKEKSNEGKVEGDVVMEVSDEGNTITPLD